jgi:hypothetical protein
VTTGSYDTSYNGFGDVFVTKIAPAGNALASSTFLGGNDEDRGQALAIDAQGSVYVSGQTMSTNFPRPSARTTRRPTGTGRLRREVLSHGQCARLLDAPRRDPDIDWAMSLCVDAQGRAIVSGGTGSPAFPTTLGAFDRIHNGGSLDAFVSMLSPTGTSLVWSTFLGGIGTDQVFGSALDPSATSI